MILKEVQVAPLAGMLEPEFYVNAKFHFRAVSMFPLNITGYLFLNGIKISNLLPYEFGMGVHDKLITMSRARDSDQTFGKSFIAPLSRRAIDALESSRAKNAKGDVLFEIKFSVNCIESSFEEVVFENTAVASIPNGSLVDYRAYPINHNHKISASDWLHDFYPHFALERFMVLELPIIEQDIKLKKDNLDKRISEAIQSFGEMKKALEKGDWNLVIKESRPIWELNRKQEEINKLLKTDDLSEVAIQSFNTLLQSLFTFASKFIHKVDDSKELMPYSRASKEDAILIYSMAASLLNLVAQKKKRFHL